MNADSLYCPDCRDVTLHDDRICTRCGHYYTSGDK